MRTEVIALAGLSILFGTGCSPSPASIEAEVERQPLLRTAFAAEGRVEGLHETVRIGSPIGGIVAAVHVKESDSVQAGQVLAAIDCSAREATVVVSAEMLKQRQRELDELIAGGRHDEISRARTLAAAAEVARDQAAREERRIRALKEGSQLVPQSDLDRASTDLRLAELQLARRHEEVSIALAEPTDEDVALAKARIDLARAELDVAEARRGECEVRAPSHGTILRVNTRVGELIPTANQEPLFFLTDLSERRVRAEIDERYVSLVHVGQEVLLQGGTSGESLGTGTVVSHELMMGRKTVRSLDPAEKNDRDVLEVTIGQLSGELNWPVGMRVNVVLTAAHGPKGETEQPE